MYTKKITKVSGERLKHGVRKISPDRDDEYNPYG